MTDTPQLDTAVTDPWHALATEQVLARLDSTTHGLTDDQRRRRLTRDGPNTITGRREEPWWEELLESLREPLQLLLIAVAVLTALFGEPSDALAIAAVIVVVAVLETVSEQRAHRAIAALAALSAPTARLVRTHGTAEVAAADLVAGDVVAVEAGDVVPADARVLSARALRVDESTLTGEAAPVGKDANPVAADADLADHSSIVYAGTAVITGEARAVVVATGARSQLGVLGQLVASTTEPPTPLQKAMTQLARTILILAIAASVMVPLTGVLAGQPWRQMLLIGLTVAFATVPEELPILITVFLAVGGRQLARRGALLRRLKAGETLGAVTTVVTDKTGTLTENQLRLHDISGQRTRVLEVALHTQPPEIASREPIEVELAAAASQRGLARVGTPVAEFPFDPTRKLVSRVWDRDLARWAAVSGAPEAILARSTLQPADRDAAELRVRDYTRQGLRVIAFACRHLPPGTPLQAEAVETDLDFVGLAAFADPLRPGVPTAVQTLHHAGVATVVITGDHPFTADAVATEAGLTPTVLLGRDIDSLNDDALAAAVRHGTVIARATPATKHRLVQVLQRRGEIVAVTGDGANDAPALAAADVGIAMGRRGADLARAAADLVLTDDAYPTVVTAIAKGRNITAQLRRAVAFYLGAKLALVAVMLTALALGLPSPFQPIHIVVLEIFMDLGASVAFVAEPAAPAAMRHPPRPPGSRFLDRTTLATIIMVGATLTLAVLPAYLAAHPNTDADGARTAAVAAWLIGHALIAWTLRTQPRLSWATNPAFPAWVITAIGTAAALTYTPLGRWIHLAPLPAHTAGALLAALLVAVATAATLRALLHLDRRL